MVLVPQVDASKELGAWLASRRSQRDASGVTADFRISDVASERGDKAAIEFRRIMIEAPRRLLPDVKIDAEIVARKG